MDNNTHESKTTSATDKTQGTGIIYKTTAPRSSRKTHRFARRLALVLVCGVVGFGGGAAAQYIFGSDESPLTVIDRSSSDGNSLITESEETIAAVAEKVGSSVVSIITTTQARSYYGTATQEGAGTGIIVSKDGYILTNNHVIDGAKTVSVVTSDGTTYDDVTVVGSDPLNDVAFVKIADVSNLTPASLGDSSSVRIGQQVVAIGNALGQYQNTVTSGIISGTGRPVTASSGTGTTTETLTDLIQTDAAINSGNSGGPLVNASGQVIGINTAVATDANGIGFAIPINATKGVLRGVLETGKISRAYLGVQYLNITPEVAKEYKLSVNQGAYVYSGSGSAVVSGGPADKAGLKQGDIITKVNDMAVGERGSVSSLIGEYRPDEKIQLTVLRDGKTVNLTVTLGEYSS